jgi:hypothetical protein
MKKNITLTVLSVLVLVACVTKKKTGTASTEPTESQLTAGKTRFPDLTLEVLKSGHTIFYGACTNCHGAKDIPSRSEEKWTHILSKMAPKAELSEEQKDQVWKYILSVKLASK